MEELLSVGIDVGTTTTSVIFSKIVLEDTSSYFSAPEIRIQSKEVIYYSKVQFTPIKNNLIDKERLKELVTWEYRNAGISPEDVKTGAVMITGESLRKENAGITAEALSQLAGDFVVATAGPDLESVLAGKGSGAYEYSISHHNRIMNFDIGGGTTNIVMFCDGKVEDKGCMDLGGRMVRIEDGLICYMSRSATILCTLYKIPMAIGEVVVEENLVKLADRVVEEILSVLENNSIRKEVQTPDSSCMELKMKPDAISFSGGVALCMKNKEDNMLHYGDIGIYLGNALSRKIDLLNYPVIENKETIHATVVGVGTYATEVSGATIFHVNFELPVKNVPVIFIENEDLLESLDSDRNVYEEKLAGFYKENKGELCAIGMKGIKNPSFKQVVCMAEKISSSVLNYAPIESPVLIILEQDMAKALGHKIQACLTKQRGILCIDRIVVHEGDYVDFGQPVMNGAIIPVIVKTLLFGNERR